MAASLAVVTLLIAALSTTPWLRQTEYTLRDNMQWRSLKITTHAELTGGREFVSGPQALAGNRLNLSAWHGNQEVQWRERLPVRTLAFRLHLAPSAYGYVLFHNVSDNEPYAGLRLSAWPEKSSAWLRIGPDRRFEEITDLEWPELPADSWLDCRLIFTDDAVTIEVSGFGNAQWAVPNVPEHHIGFRGSHAPVAVDDVVITTPTATYRDDFAPPLDVLPALWAALWKLGIVSSIVALILLLFGLSARERWLILVSLHVSIIFISGILYFFFVHIYASMYPRLDEALEASENQWVRRNAAIRSEKLVSAYTLKPPPSTVRLIFLGTSQTAGEGAQSIGEGLVERLEQRLNAGGNEIVYQCVNLGIPGTRLDLLLQAYRSSWINYQPDLLVVNLGCNDQGRAEAFEQELRELVALNQQNSILTLFSLEAMSADMVPDYVPSHHAMQRVADDLDIPVVDSHGYLSARHDTGMLWWDVVHPTSYGHSLIAEALYPAITDLLAETPATDLNSR